MKTSVDARRITIPTLKDNLLSRQKLQVKFKLKPDEGKKIIEQIYDRDPDLDRYCETCRYVRSKTCGSVKPKEKCDALPPPVIVPTVSSLTHSIDGNCRYCCLTFGGFLQEANKTIQGDPNSNAPDALGEVADVLLVIANDCVLLVRRLGMDANSKASEVVDKAQQYANDKVSAVVDKANAKVATVVDKTNQYVAKANAEYCKVMNRAHTCAVKAKDKVKKKIKAQAEKFNPVRLAEKVKSETKNLMKPSARKKSPIGSIISATSVSSKSSTKFPKKKLKPKVSAREMKDNLLEALLLQSKRTESIFRIPCKKKPKPRKSRLFTQISSNLKTARDMKANLLDALMLESKSSQKIRDARTKAKRKKSKWTISRDASPMRKMSESLLNVMLCKKKKPKSRFSAGEIKDKLKKSCLSLTSGGSKGSRRPSDSGKSSILHELSANLLDAMLLKKKKPKSRCSIGEIREKLKKSSLSIGSRKSNSSRKSNGSRKSRSSRKSSDSSISSRAHELSANLLDAMMLKKKKRKSRFSIGGIKKKLKRSSLSMNSRKSSRSRKSSHSRKSSGSGKSSGSIVSSRAHELSANLLDAMMLKKKKRKSRFSIGGMKGKLKRSSLSMNSRKSSRSRKSSHSRKSSGSGKSSGSTVLIRAHELSANLLDAMLLKRKKPKSRFSGIGEIKEKNKKSSLQTKSQNKKAKTSGSRKFSGSRKSSRSRKSSGSGRLSSLHELSANLLDAMWLKKKEPKGRFSGIGDIKEKLKKSSLQTKSQNKKSKTSGSRKFSGSRKSSRSRKSSGSVRSSSLRELSANLLDAMLLKKKKPKSRVNRIGEIKEKLKKSSLQTKSQNKKSKTSGSRKFSGSRQSSHSHKSSGSGRSSSLRELSANLLDAMLLKKKKLKSRVNRIGEIKEKLKKSSLQTKISVISSGSRKSRGSRKPRSSRKPNIAGKSSSLRELSANLLDAMLLKKKKPKSRFSRIREITERIKKSSLSKSSSKPSGSRKSYGSGNSSGSRKSYGSGKSSGSRKSSASRKSGGWRKSGGSHKSYGSGKSSSLQELGANLMDALLLKKKKKPQRKFSVGEIKDKLMKSRSSRTSRNSSGSRKSSTTRKSSGLRKSSDSQKSSRLHELGANLMDALLLKKKKSPKSKFIIGDVKEKVRKSRVHVKISSKSNALRKIRSSHKSNGTRKSYGKSSSLHELSANLMDALLLKQKKKSKSSVNLRDHIKKKPKRTKTPKKHNREICAASEMRANLMEALMLSSSGSKRRKRGKLMNALIPSSSGSKRSRRNTKPLKSKFTLPKKSSRGSSLSSGFIDALSLKNRERTSVREDIKILNLCRKRKSVTRVLSNNMMCALLLKQGSIARSKSKNRNRKNLKRKKSSKKKLAKKKSRRSYQKKWRMLRQSKSWKSKKNKSRTKTSPKLLATLLDALMLKQIKSSRSIHKFLHISKKCNCVFATLRKALLLDVR